MFKYNVFIGFILFSGVTMSAGEPSKTFWSCASVDAQQNLFSGWASSLAKAQEQAVDNCSAYSEVSGECVLAEEACEQIEL